jgi:hypothetical protein
MLPMSSLKKLDINNPGLAKTRFFKKSSARWVLLGFLGFIGFFFYFRPIKSIFLRVFVLLIYLLADEFK